MRSERRRGRGLQRGGLAALLLVPLLAACANPELPAKTPAAQLSGQAVGDALERAALMLADGRNQDAFEEYGRVLSADPDNAEAKLGIAEARMADGNLQQAKELFDETAKIPAAKPRGLQGRGLALLMLGQRDGATEALRGAVEADPKLWRAWNALGQLADDQRQWDEARASYDKALATTTAPWIVYNNIGFSLLLQGKQDESREFFAKSLQLHPGTEVADNNRRLALALQGKYAEAVTGVAKERLPAALNNAGYAAMLRGEYPGAEAYLARAIESSPSFYEMAAKNMLRLNTLSGRDGEPAPVTR
jgi:Flp pilus assembly protein TadD